MALRELCKPCAVELARHKDVIFVYAGRDRKGTCWLCGRRRYVATYTINRIGAARNKKEAMKP